MTSFNSSGTLGSSLPPRNNVKDFIEHQEVMDKQISVKTHKMNIELSKATLAYDEQLLRL